jgi:hypothetical protein
MSMLLVFLGALLFVGIRCFRVSRGLVLALVVLLLARCVTEASLRTEGLLTWTTFINVLLVVSACYFLRRVELPRVITLPESPFGVALNRGA